MVGKVGRDEKQAFKTLLVIDSLRGPHSTGVAVTRANNTVDVIKQEGGPHQLFDRKGYDTIMAGVGYCYIGHNRYATQGAINSRNAHPFAFEKVVGAHNGTLRGQYRLPDYKDFEVDSENIYHSINIDGVDETLPKLDGAYALSYWDVEDESLVLLRNKERPLFITRSVDKKTVFWASEEWMLTIALSRSGVKFEDPVELPVNHIYRFKPERAYTAKEVEVSFKEFTPLYVPPAKTWPTYGKGSYSAGNKAPAVVNSPDFDEKKGAEMQRLSKGKFYVSFTFESKNKISPQSPTTYMSCRVSEYAHPNLAGVEVRLYPPQDSKEFELLSNSSDTEFQAKVMGMVSPGEKYGYLLADFKSLCEVEPAGETIEGMSEQEFLDRTSDGCVTCNGLPLYKTRDEVVWYGENLFECAACAQLSEKRAW